MENYKQSSLKVVAYERWSPTRGSIYSDLKTFGILEKWSLMRGGRLREVVAKGGSTVVLIMWLKVHIMVMLMQNQTSLKLNQCSIECRKTKIKVIIRANRKKAYTAQRIN